MAGIKGVKIDHPVIEDGPVTGKKVAKLLLKYEAALNAANAQIVEEKK